MRSPQPDAAPAYDAAAARRAIHGLAIQTPLLRSPALERLAGVPVALKLESLQVTGSFKVRGAANRMAAMSASERARGVVACSSGNHGLAVAYVAARLGIPATVCLPDWVDPLKRAAIRRYGAETLAVGNTYDEAEGRSVEIARSRGIVNVHPFDDPYVIAGQGTIGLEILERCDRPSTVIVPVSGGGLIAGIALALTARDPAIRIVGVSAQNACVMLESLRAGRPIECPEEPTVANALAGGIGLANEHTFTLVRDHVAEHVLVTEDEIQRAMLFLADEHHLIVEGGGAVGVAAVLSGKLAASDGLTIVIVSGGNIQLSAWWKIIRTGRAIARVDRS